MTRTRVTRKISLRWGVIAEYVSAFYLILKAYSVLTMRYRIKEGEVDLIIRRGRTIAFVEVKARADFASGMDAIDEMKLKKFRKAVDHWLMRNPWAEAYTLRGDAVVVRPWRLPVHIEDAFPLALS